MNRRWRVSEQCCSKSLRTKLIVFTVIVVIIMISIKLIAILYTYVYVVSHTEGKQVDITHRATFEITIGGRFAGKIVMGLFGKITPKTVANFAALADSDGFQGLSYKGSIFHRVIPKFMIQGGDITSRDGRGSVSIYGTKFDDENFDIKHTEAGLLSMANAGKDTNGSQFFITLVTTPWLDGKHTVFGKVLAGMDVVHEIENLKTVSDKPVDEVLISNTQVEEVEQSIEMQGQ